MAAVLGVFIWIIMEAFKKEKLPSGKPFPKNKDLWNMTADDLIREYSELDLKRLKRHVMRKFTEINPDEFALWSQTNRNLYIALYGYK